MFEKELTASPAPAGGMPTLRLPFAFARRHGVLLIDDVDARLACRGDATMPALAEAQRIAGRTLVPQTVADEAFEQLLQQVYQQDSGSAMSMAIACQRMTSASTCGHSLLRDSAASES